MTSNDEGNTQKNEGVVEKVIKIFEKGWNKQVILYGPPGTSKNVFGNYYCGKVFGRK